LPHTMFAASAMSLQEVGRYPPWSDSQLAASTKHCRMRKPFCPYVPPNASTNYEPPAIPNRKTPPASSRSVPIRVLVPRVQNVRATGRLNCSA
jgi:hypothetical protein